MTSTARRCFFVPRTGQAPRVFFLARTGQAPRAVPEVAGVNNHQGSQSTADVALMDELMPVLREHRLFYIDSRTTATTVAYDAARRAGLGWSWSKWVMISWEH